jgi:outer membrane protein W
MGKQGVIPSPTGTTAISSNHLSDDYTGMVPISIDLGYRINPAIYVGVFAQYGFVSFNHGTNPACLDGFDCSAHDIRFGLDLHYHFLADVGFDPWIGAGVGYEMLDFSASGSVRGQAIREDGNIRGFEFLNLQAGDDFHVTPHLVVGPFIAFSLGRFSSYSLDITSAGVSQSPSGDLRKRGIHEWLTIGVRGQYGL